MYHKAHMQVWNQEIFQKRLVLGHCILLPWASYRGGQGVEGVWEVGGDRAGSSIPKVAGTRRNILKYCVTFYNLSRSKRWEPPQKGARNGSKRYRRQKFQLAPPPPPCLHPTPCPSACAKVTSCPRDIYLFGSNLTKAVQTYYSQTCPGVGTWLSFSLVW